MKSLFVIFLILSTSLIWKNSGDKIFSITWPEKTYDYSVNPRSDSKIQLGRALFYDPILSKDNSISCSSCHLQATGFTHVDHDLSHGIDGRIGTRNSMALMNLAWSTSFMWDGGVPALDRQTIAPITDHNEMDEDLKKVLKKLNKLPRYRKAFLEAFGAEEATTQNLLFAISQFELELISNNSKYDKYLRGEAQFNEQEQNGLQLFRNNCASCHTEPLFTSHKFENNGLPLDPTLMDYGRKKITNLAEDAQKFKVPTLRNIKHTYPYMHDGRFSKLREVLDHYTDNIERSSTLSPQFKKAIKLSSNEKADIIAFLFTLTDDDFLFNPKFGYPREFFSKE